MKQVQCETHLPHVVAALYLPRRLTRLLYGRKEERHQNRNDGDHHQQLNNRKTGNRPAHGMAVAALS
jgi:hypothetical protein